MPYSKSKSAIRRVEVYLKQMVDSTQKLEFPSNNPTKLARHLFEGIKASSHYQKDEPYGSYSRLGAKYKIQNKEIKVVCEPRDISILTGSSALSSVTLDKINTTLGILGAAITHKQSIMEFPDAKNLTQLDLLRLHNWCSATGYILVVSDEGIKLSKDENHRNLEWQP